MNRARLFPLGTLALLVAGCAATPALDIHPLTPALAAGGAMPFRLTDAVIALGLPAKPGAGDKPAAPVSFATDFIVCPARNAPATDSCSPAIYPVVAPADFTGATYALTTRSRKFVETRIAPTYARNALRLAELAVEVKDHRMEVINAVGTVAAGVAGLAADQSGNEDTQDKPVITLPVIIDAADARAPDTPGARCRPAPTGIVAGGAGGCHKLPGNPDWSYRLVATDDPAAQGFVPRAAIASLRDVMVASICRPARLEIDHEDSEGVRPLLTLRLTIVDPDWLSTMPLPAKGQLVFHPLCGMDLKRQQVTETGIDAMTRAVFDQIAAVRAATQ